MTPIRPVFTFAPHIELDVPLAERLLLDIIDTVREPLLVLDHEFRVVRANRAFAQAFQVALEDTVGHVVFDLGDGQWDIAPLHDLLRDRLTIHPNIRDIEVDHVFPTIGHKIMVLNAQVVHDATHGPRVFLLAIEDVTHRRYVERELDERRLELERSNSALDEFAFVASHELQEPLRKILAFGDRLQTASAGALNADATHALSRMLDATGRMRTLVHDVLAYSQMAARTRPFEATDIERIVRHVLVELETAISETATTVNVGTLPVIQADARQIEQLLQNLIGNAIKYRRPGVPPVITIGAMPAHGGSYTITISDNGIGFKTEQALKIFQMFERLHNRTQYEGSGIGLSICKKIVESHGGTITATSTPGEGSTFSITLPVTRATKGLAS